MDDFLGLLAAPTPTPGGGSAAAFVAAVAAALCEMVAGLGAARGREGADAVAALARDMRARLLRQAVEDGQAFDRVMEAYRLPREDPGRSAAIAAALRSAALSPLGMLDAMAELGDLLARAGPVCPSSARSDLDGARIFLRSAADVAARNVTVNLGDADGAAELAAMLQEKLRRLAPLTAEA